jgi:uncharacterized membrane protein YqgA involved in biofilm formation
MAKKRIWHIVEIVAGTLLGALAEAVVEKVLIAFRRIIEEWEVTKPMTRRRIWHIVEIVVGTLLGALAEAMKRIRHFVATVENSRVWRWMIDKLLDALLDILLQALVAAAVQEVLSALLKHLF